jgi:hypothetical protein
MLLRRLARRGGVVRMSNDIYDDVRVVLKKRLATVRKPNPYYLAWFGWLIVSR